MKQIDIDKVAAKNPKVNAAQVKEALESLKRLREAGVRRQEYSTLHPFSDSIRAQRTEGE